MRLRVPRISRCARAVEEKPRQAVADRILVDHRGVDPATSDVGEAS
jgi:hypothetical protein